MGGRELKKGKKEILREKFAMMALQSQENHRMQVSLQFSRDRFDDRDFCYGKHILTIPSVFYKYIYALRHHHRRRWTEETARSVAA
jgi:hypothetical protein